MGQILKLFQRGQKPRQQDMVAVALMLSWHPVLGFAAHDPLARRHLVHDPNTTIIHDFPSPAKLAANYFPVMPGQKPRLPRELAGAFTVAQSAKDGPNGRIERYEMAVGGREQPFVVERIISPDQAEIQLRASYGNLERQHRAALAPDQVSAYRRLLGVTPSR